MVAAEERPRAGPGEADVVGTVSRGVDDLQGPPVARDYLAVVEQEIGYEFSVHAPLQFTRRIPGVGSEGEYRCAGALPEQPGRR